MATLLAPKAAFTVFSRQYEEAAQMTESDATSYLYDSGPAHMLSSGGTIEHSITIRGPLDVPQPSWPVGVAHQVCVEGYRVIAGITCRQSSLMRGSLVNQHQTILI